MATFAHASRRNFVMCCACAGCAGVLKGADVAGGKGKGLKAPASAADGLSWAKANVIKSFDFAYCGIYCTACALHLTGGKDGKKCKGCTHPSKESTCKVFACAKDKRVSNCGLCERFDSCEILKKHHEKPLYRQVARRTCERIKQNGVEAVAAEQKVRWTCKACGKLFPWNTTGTCPHCGKPVEALSEKEA